MITTILSDFSRVILFPKDPLYTGTLNSLHKELSQNNVNYPFFDYFQFNNKILDLYKKLKANYSVNIFTSGTIQNKKEAIEVIDLIFKNIYTAKDYSLDKKQPDSYLFIAKKLNKHPHEIVFIDDQDENISAAKKAGFHTVIYKDDFVLFYNELNDKLNGNI